MNLKKHYPVTCFTLHETDQSLLSNAHNNNYDTIEELFESKLGEKGHMCKATILEKWGFPLVVLKCKIGEKLISDLEIQNLCNESQ